MTERPDDSLHAPLYPPPPPAYPPPPTYSPAPSAAAVWTQPPEPPPRSGRTNGFAVCALVFGILAGPVGLALGLIALKQIRLRGDDGRGMAIAGIVVGSVWTAVLGLAVLGALVGEPERDPSGEVTQGGRISVYELRVGDCFDGLEDRALVMSVEVRPCSQPHDGEVVDTFTMPDGPYPGDDEVIDTVEQECADRLSDKLATSPLYDRLQLYSFYPTSVSWKTGDRDALCAVADGDNVKLTEPVLPR